MEETNLYSVSMATMEGVYIFAIAIKHVTSIAGKFDKKLLPWNETIYSEIKTIEQGTTGDSRPLTESPDVEIPQYNS